MASTFISQSIVVLREVSTEITNNQILGLTKKYSPKRDPKIILGNPYYKNGKKFRSIYVTLDKSDSVNKLMSDRSHLRLNGKQVKVKRSLPDWLPLYNRDVTGIKVKISDDISAVKLNAYDLKDYFQKLQFSKVLECKWTNENHTEALFKFDDYDSVDHIILHNSSPIIKGIKVELEKTFTNEDYPTNEHPYVIHITNLPLCVTSEDISKHFEVPISVILLHPCFRKEASYVVNGRSSSEAWIKNFIDEETAQRLAQEKNGTFIRTNKIECEAMLEQIDKQDPELCRNFQIGQCPFTIDVCHFKHYTCSEPDTCDNEYCWYGHTQKRTTISVGRPKYQNGQYRVRLSNLPSDITDDSLIRWMELKASYSKNLKLQKESSNSPKMAYLQRQPVENRLRQLIDGWHNKPFSPISQQKVQCQLELDQEYHEWDDLAYITRPLENIRCASPVSRTFSISSRTSETSRSTNTNYWQRNSNSKTLHSVVAKSSQVSQLPIPKTRPTNSLKSKSITGNRQRPSDLSDRWHWTDQMVLNEKFDQDELYWIETESNKQKNIVGKFYLPKGDQVAQIRARCEQIILNQLADLPYVPKLLDSNVDASNKQLWNVMKLCNGERLSDYIKSYKLDLREALNITRRLLNIVKQIHNRNVFHRDIQLNNILIQQQQNANEINLMLINFTSARIQSKGSIEQLEDQSIDITSISKSLLWLITDHRPGELQDDFNQPPHRLRKNQRSIEKKIDEITAFTMEMKTHEHLQKHLMHVFDRCFIDVQQQWSLDELDYQFQFMISLIEIEKDEANHFPRNTNIQISLPSIPLDDPFVYIVSLVYHLKHQLTLRYSQCIYWSMKHENPWLTSAKQTEHNDMLIFSYQTKNLRIHIQWNIKMFEDKQFSIDIKATTDDKHNIELPMGIWKINEPTHHFDLHFNYFQMEMKTLINILCQSIAF